MRNRCERLAPTVLAGELVELHLLGEADDGELARTCLDPRVWQHTIAKIRTAEELKAYLDRGRVQYAAGEAVPYAIRLRSSGCAVGSTKLARTAHPNVLEIGWTFIAPAWQRKGVNSEAKLLLLDHAFAARGCERVVFKVAAGNERSAAALQSFGARACEALPAVNEKWAAVALRWFEITAERWPASRALLEARVTRHLEPERQTEMVSGPVTRTDG